MIGRADYTSAQLAGELPRRGRSRFAIIVQTPGHHTLALRRRGLTARQRRLCARGGHIRPLVLSYYVRHVGPSWVHVTSQHCGRCGAVL